MRGVRGREDQEEGVERARDCVKREIKRVGRGGKVRGENRSRKKGGSQALRKGVREKIEGI